MLLFAVAASQAQQDAALPSEAHDLVARARALTEKGVALRVAASSHERRLAAGSRIATPRSWLNIALGEEANDAFVEALTLLAPQVAVESRDGRFTELTAAYVAALLETADLHARFFEHEAARPRTPGVDPLAYALAADAVPYCEMWLTDPSGTLPVRQRQELLEEVLGVGAIVVRIRSDETGQVLERDLLAATPAGPFEDAIRRVLTEWVLERVPGRGDTCSQAGVRHVGVAVSVSWGVRSLVLPEPLREIPRERRRERRGGRR
jgi:hypothetical protein